MQRIIGKLALVFLAMLTAGCSSVPNDIPTPAGSCTEIKASGETESTMKTWEKSVDRVIGLGTFKCDFAGSVEITIPEHIADALYEKGTLLYSGENLPQIGIVGPGEVNELFGEVQASPKFQKDTPFQILTRLSPKETINFLDLSFDKVGLMFSNDLGGKPIAKNQVISLQIGF